MKGVRAAAASLLPSMSIIIEELFSVTVSVPVAKSNEFETVKFSIVTVEVDPVNKPAARDSLTELLKCLYMYAGAASEPMSPDGASGICEAKKFAVVPVEPPVSNIVKFERLDVTFPPFIISLKLLALTGAADGVAFDIDADNAPPTFAVPGRNVATTFLCPPEPETTKLKPAA